MLSPEDTLLSVIVAAIVGVTIFLVLSGRVKILQSKLENITNSVNQWTDWLQKTDTASLRQEFSTQFQKFGEDILGRIDSVKRLSSEEVQKIREDIVQLAEQRSIDAAVNHIKDVTITREEFERLRETVVRLGGKEEEAERIELLARILDTADIRVLMWECRMINLLEGGLAPEAEEDTLLASGIPLAAGKRFVKTLEDMQIVAAKRVQSYWLRPDYSWLTTYVKDPHWLKERLENLVKKESEYEGYIRQNIEHLESGLVVVSEQFDLPSGKVDIFARDIKGADVCIELKYPVATSSVVGQLLKYREDQRVRAAGVAPRCILVCPAVSEKLRNLLEKNSMEWREMALNVA